MNLEQEYIRVKKRRDELVEEIFDIDQELNVIHEKMLRERADAVIPKLNTLSFSIASLIADIDYDECKLRADLLEDWETFTYSYDAVTIGCNLDYFFIFGSIVDVVDFVKKNNVRVAPGNYPKEALEWQQQAKLKFDALWELFS